MSYIEDREKRESRGIEFNCLVINLSKEGVVDSEEFKNACYKLDPRNASRLNFFVLADKIFIFKDYGETEDPQIKLALSSLGIYWSMDTNEEIQCAGNMQIRHDKDLSAIQIGDKMLEATGYLKPKKSSVYAEKILKERIGHLFTHF